MTIHEPAQRQLIIGLDGGAWDILGPLCDLGEMPQLARLRAQGAWGPLRSTVPPFTAPAWSTFLTGVNPGQHGILQFLQPFPNPAQSLRGEGQPINSTCLAAPTLWEYFNAAGRTVGHVNVPLSYPLRPLDGFAVSGMLTPPGAADWTYPPELAAELNGYVIDLDYAQPGQPYDPAALPSLAQMLADIARMTERQGFHALRMIQERRWDVFMVVFTGTDRLFHHFWHYLQAGSSDVHGLEMALSDQLRRFFTLLDHIIGGLIRAVDENTHIIVMSDHGFGPAARHWVHLNNWLIELDLMHLASTGGWVQRLKRSAPWLTDIAKRILPREVREAVRQHGHLADAVHWPETQAWAVPLYNNVAGIYLHHASRYEQGPVSPAAADPLGQRLLAEAAALRIPGANRPLVTAAQLRHELFHGQRASEFPDIILTLDPDYAAVPDLGSSLITPIPHLLRTGDHRPDGIFVAYGPNIRPGRLSSTPQLLDLAPTLLHLLDLPVPASMEGSVIMNAFHDGYLVLHPPRMGPDLPPPPLPTQLSPSEADAVAARLRGLGYLA